MIRILFPKQQQMFGVFAELFLTFKLTKLRALKSSQHETLTIQSLQLYTLKDIFPESAPSCTSQKFSILYNFLSIFANMLSFSAVTMLKKSSIKIFMQKYNFSYLCKMFVNIMCIQQLEVSVCCIIDHFQGYQRFETDFFCIFHA